MKLIKAALAGCAALLFVLSCSKPVQAGIVIERKYEPAHTTMVSVSDYRYMCYMTTRAFTTYSNGRSTTTYRSVQDCGMRYAGSHFEHRFIPDHYRVKLRDDNDETHTGWVELTPDQYNSQYNSQYPMGGHYPDAR